MGAQTTTTKYAIAGIAAAVAVIGIIALIIAQSPGIEKDKPPFIDEGTFTDDTFPTPFESTQTLKKFASTEDLKNFLLVAEQRNYIMGSRYGPGFMGSDAVFEMAPASPLAERAQLQLSPVPSSPFEISSYSTTNVQVSNVDEPDFLKNDGKYVYILSNDRLTIVEAYPPESAKVILKIGLDVKGQSLQNMFLHGDRLIIFYQGEGERYDIEEYGYRPIPVYTPTTHALILDVSDKQNVKIVKDYEVSGYYQNARMIGDNVYFIANNNVDFRDPIIPFISESSKMVMSPDIYYFDNPEEFYNFNTISALDVIGGEINAQTFMMGPASTLYVSEHSIYITYTKHLPYPYKTNSKEKFFTIILPLLPDDVQEKIRAIENSDMDAHEKWQKISDLLQETYNKLPQIERERLFSKIQKAVEEYELRIAQEVQRTIIHKVGMDRLALTYESKAEVPGFVLNQFSMDEHDGKFRIATTSEHFVSRGSSLSNNVYVLDENLSMIGSLEKIAPRESIYSARFMGDRLYLVTFERIDPFFVIDLSTNSPKILGELKMPGFSNYLHPYDENHIIGIGRETKESMWGGVQTLGVKVALFDVSHVTNPKVIDEFMIGDQTTNSEVLHDHKAFLFDGSKGIMSIPIESSVYIGRPFVEEGMPIRPESWKGFYVFGINPATGIELKGKVEHSSGYDYYGYGYGSRSFYINSALYTVTGTLMKMNDLQDMGEINEIKLFNTGEVIKYID
jgi:uncharacterized secreted protein with C-terminal beta-propeller domain